MNWKIVLPCGILAIVLAVILRLSISDVVCRSISENLSRAPADEEASSLADDSASSSAVEPASTPEESKPQLKLLSWHWQQSESDYYVEAEGQVKNLTGDNLESVEAVVTYYTKEGGFICSDSALVEYNPILPGQTSPFDVISTYNPKMKKAIVEFKYLLGGTLVTQYPDR